MKSLCRCCLQAICLFATFIWTTSVWAMSVTPSPSYTGSYTVSWSQPLGVYLYYSYTSSYVLQEKVGSGAWTDIDYTQGRTSRSFSGKAVNTYQYRIMFYIYGGSGATEGPVSVQVKKPSTPSTPTGPSTDNNGAYTISWGSSTGASYYQLQEYLSSWSTIVSANQTSVARSGRGNGIWYYRARACSTVGCSGWTANKSVIVANTPATPATPTGPGTDSDGAYTISWAAVSGTTKYQLYEKKDSGSWSSIHYASGTSKARSGLSNGTWSYIVRACAIVSTYTTCSGWSGTKSVIVWLDNDGDGIGDNADPDDDNDGMPDTWELAHGLNPLVADGHLDPDGDGYTNLDEFLNNTDPFAVNSNVGFTPGGFSVDAAGGANYAIPITVPPGTAGMQPSLSLSYSSHRGSSLLGQGWALGGLSAITRCPATVVQDGFIDPIDFDANDRFCIGGQRLVLINGTTHNYGDNGAEYRTEKDGFTRVISYGAVGGGPVWFKIWTKGGQIKEYGATADARIEAAGRADNAVRLWAVNKISDVAGNYLTVSYTENVTTGEYRSTNIEYTMNDAAGQTLPYASVQFSYATRSDQATRYLGGSLVMTTQRLTNIKTYESGALIKDYSLTYDNSGINGVSRLTSIMECNAEGICFPPSLFAWDGNGSQPTLNNNIASPVWSSYNFITGDWNGDGRTDLFLQNINPNSGISYMYTANEQGLMVSTGFSHAMWTGTVYTGDWDGDGRTDMARHEIDGELNTISFYKSTGSSMVATGQTLNINSDTSGWVALYLPAISLGQTGTDWNGDGRTDIIIQQFNSTTLIYTNDMYIADSNGQMVYTGYSTSEYIQQHGDWNGDGRTDIITNIAGTARIYFSTGTGMQLINADSGLDLSGYRAIQGDFNGDGYSDLFFKRILEWIGPSQLYLSKGDGTFEPSGYSPTGWNYYNIIVGDWNGDGKTDLARIHESSTTSNFYYSTGTGMASTGFNPAWGGYQQRIVTGDWNGDGLTDLWRYEPNLSTPMTSYQYKTVHSGFDIIGTITDGLGADTQVVYKPLTNSSVYSRSGVGSYPDLIIQKPMYVVQTATVDNGIGGTRSAGYFYTDAMTNLEGRGFLGFKTMTVTDSGTGIKTQTTYRQDFPYEGMVAASEQRLSDNTLIGKVTSSYANFTTAGNAKFPYADSVTKYDYELDGTLVTTATIVNTYDSYGNPTGITVTATGAGDTFTSVVTNDYYNNTSDWHLGRLICAQVSRTVPSDPYNPGLPVTENRISGFEYDAVTGLLNREVVEPKSADILEPGALPDCVTTSTDSNITFITDYDYDSFGNRTTVTVDDGPGGIASRTTSTTWGELDAASSITLNGRFAVKVENALNHIEYREYDSRFGAIKRLTGPNNIDTTWSYDSFGWQLSEHRADGTSTTLIRQWCDGYNGEQGNPKCPAGGALALTTQTTGAPATVVYTDKLGREIQSEADAFDVNKVVLLDTVYDALGRVKRKSRPYFYNLSTQTADPKYETVYDYDIIGRLIRENNPDTSRNEIVYNGLTTTSEHYKDSVATTPETLTTQINNVRGELVQAVDALGTLTVYRYDPFGNLAKVINDAATGGKQIPITNFYDIRGRKLQMDDPDMGTWTYAYDALSQLDNQTDAKGQITVMEYDLLGRLFKRTDDSGGLNHQETQWNYDTATGAGIGRLHKVEHYDGVIGGIGIPLIDSNTASYDSLGRLASSTTRIDSTDYTLGQDYDIDGRVSTLTYPASVHYPQGYKVAYGYTARGYLEKVCDDALNPGCAGVNNLYWQAKTLNAAGQLTEVALGNTLVTKYGYQPQTSLLDTIVTSTAGGNGDRQDLQYLFDTQGNLKNREDFRINRFEEFAYDGLNRLTVSTLKDAANGYSIIDTKSYSYDVLGNIETKAGIGGFYGYGSGNNIGTGDAGPHAVINAGGQSFDYDDNGNLINGYNFTQVRGREITWSAYNKPIEIKEGADLLNPDMTLSFTYGADRARVKQVIDNGMTTTTRIYVSGLYEKETSSGLTTHVHYITVDGQAIALYKSKSDTSEETLYLHRDHIGSVTAITDDIGNIILDAEFSYDAFGKRRNAGDWSDATLQLTSADTPQGFTGHEQLDDVSLVHMNGRVYDPDLGRLASADPFVQHPTFSQSYNRYSYVLNNPLSFTDPTGFESNGLQVFFGMIVGQYGGRGYTIVHRTIQADAGTYYTGVKETSGLVNYINSSPISTILVTYNFPGNDNYGIVNSNILAISQASNNNRHASDEVLLSDIFDDNPFEIESEGVDVACAAACPIYIIVGGVVIYIGLETEAGQIVLSDIYDASVVSGFKFFEQRVRVIQEALGVTANGTGPDDEEDGKRDGSQDKKLSDGEIKKLKDNRINPEELKGGKRTGRLDLFKDRDGNIYVKLKNGKGPGDPTGININNL